MFQSFDVRAAFIPHRLFSSEIRAGEIGEIAMCSFKDSHQTGGFAAIREVDTPW
jgi:hypothetical protein